MIADSMHEKMKGWGARIILGILILAFAWTGIDTYNRSGAGVEWVAKVGDEKIPRLEFEEALKREQNRLRQAGERSDTVLKNPALARRVLDEMVKQRLLTQAALGAGYGVDEAALIAAVQRDPVFQENGQFSEARFKRVLEAARLTRKQYLASIAQEVLVRDLLTFRVQTGIVSREALGRLAQAMAEEREVARLLLRPEDFIQQVTVEAAAIQAFYERDGTFTTVPERVRLEYVVFSPETLLANVQVSDAEARTYYETHLAQFSTPEQRTVAHILIRVPPDASAERQQAARTQAQTLLETLRADPRRFGELARVHSQDPSTAARGGSLGSIKRGTVFPGLEEVAFKLAVGEVAGPVQTPAGLHLVTVSAVEPAKQRPYEEVKELAREGARRELALRRFNEQAELFGDAVYARPESLKPAAEQFGLTVHTSEWIERGRPPAGPLGHERVLAAVFAPEALKERRNTEAIEVSPNVFVAARVAQYQPAGKRPLEEVVAQIVDTLKRERAAALARARGEALLADLVAGKAVQVAFAPPRRIDREQAGREGIGRTEVEALFRADARVLPAYAGAALEDGSYVVLRITRVGQSESLRQQAERLLPSIMREALAEQTARAYLESLKQNAKIKVREDLLAKAVER